MSSKPEQENSVSYDSSKWADFFGSARERLQHEQKSFMNFMEDSDEDSESEPYKKYKDAFIYHMKCYENSHSPILNESFKHYETAISLEFFKENYRLLKGEDLNSVLSRCKVMVLTANPIEKAILHFKMTKQGQKIRRIINGNNTYFIFKWGKYWVAHIHQTETGSNKNLGTNAAIYEALKHFTPNVIISLGVAFGIDYESQSIGDVLVSKRILPYSENKRDEDKIKPDRSQDKTIDDWLHVRLSNATGFLDNVLYGDILSGGSVMSSFREKDKICLGYTKADFIIGGEMEGDALFQCAKRNGIPGVVIKGICDWGGVKNGIFPDDPKRDKIFKKSLQAFAMECAIEKSELLFNDKEIFAEPKNVDIVELGRKYKFTAISLLASQILIIFRVLFSLLSNLEYNEFLSPFITLMRDIFENPVLWICIALTILGIMFFNSTKWRKRKQSKYYINRELKGTGEPDEEISDSSLSNRS